jgi:glycosyltransferase involved in cell wall biosynthesis
MESGISFIVRARNEERTLEACLRSLKGLTIPYEIVLVLHMTSDRSKEIADALVKEGMPLVVFRYDKPLSRAGYENLVTDMESPHSMRTFSKWSFDKAMCPWKFRWDADFIASPELIAKLNSREWVAPTNTTRIRIPAVSVNARNEECYLFSGTYEYRKYIFWEYTEFIGQLGYEHWTDATIEHASDLKEKKPYWSAEPWFLSDTSEEAQTLRTRYAALVAICGPEPHAQARASNPESDPVFFKVQQNEALLERIGISLTR